jgi:protein TonB
MDAQAILTSDYLDILFRERNKAYGSYELRKNYTIRLQKALLFIMLLCSFSAFLLRGKRPSVVVPPPERGVYQLRSIPMEPIALPERRATEPPAAPASLHTTAKSSVIKVVADKAVKEPEASASPEPIVAPSELAGSGKGEHPVTGTTGDAENVKPLVLPGKEPAISKPVRYVEQMPQFDDLNEYLSAHLRYPVAAKENNIQGKVSVEFVVNEDGSISNARVVRGIGGGCDEEALRVINAMPKWKPGRQNGKAVKVCFVLPIVFVLN